MEREGAFNVVLTRGIKWIDGEVKTETSLLTPRRRTMNWNAFTARGWGARLPPCEG